VNADRRPTAAACLGVLMLKLVTSGGYRAYVRPRMGLLLLLAGFSLAGVAFICLISSLRSPLRDGRRPESSPIARGTSLVEPSS